MKNYHAHQMLGLSAFIAEHKAAITEAQFETADRHISQAARRISSLQMLAGRSTTIWQDLRGTKMIGLLREAVAQNSVEAYKYLLLIILDQLEAKPPEGVFTPPRTRTHGRPISDESERIYSIWARTSDLAPNRNEFAFIAYGEQFTKASGTERRKMRDRCRRAVERISNARSKP